MSGLVPPSSVPPRTAARVPDGLLGVMPGYVPGLGLEAKLVTVFPGNRPAIGLYRRSGFQMEGVRRAAEHLGIGYSTLKNKVKAYGLTPDSGSDDEP